MTKYSNQIKVVKELKDIIQILNQKLKNKKVSG